MRQFVNFPNGVGKYKNYKLNINGLNGAAYAPSNGADQIILVPAIGDQTIVVSIELAGADQSAARFLAFAKAFNAAIVAEPGGISVDVVETINNIEVTNV